ncbi:MAG: ABC transporter ATP-binding protein [Acetatifactor sp.]|nr:ABC transporter ATP-binding protein [Acetatifactor sp.]
MSRIVVENLVKTIKDALILDHINLVMESGKIYGLRGKNGCGKTMLMRAICGLILPTEGKVLIDNKELHREIQVPPSIGVLIENPSFLPQYTGYRNLEMLGDLSDGISKDDIRISMERVGLDPEDKRVYRKYSLGMKQKLGIANAIMGEPDVIILDEPINALDEESTGRIKTVLKELAEKGKLILVACHDREELEFLSDVIYEMKDGRIEGTEVVSK